MKHFKLVTHVDTRPFLDELEANPELWYVDTSRQDNIAKQRETQTITLRSHADVAHLDSKVRRARPIGYRGQPSAMSAKLAVASRYVDELVKSMNGKMGRAVMTNLKPHGVIYPHTDDGLYWLLRDRYHLVLKSAKGSLFKAGGEECRMQEGELWWFDPTVPHEAFNDSDEDRIHIIVDVMSPRSMRTFMRRIGRAPLRSTRALVEAAARRIVWPIRRRAYRASAKT